MKRNKNLTINEDRHIIQENPKLNFFQGKLRKDFDYIRSEFQHSTRYGIKIDSLIDELQEIKEFIETHFKDKYTDIFVIVHDDWVGEDYSNMHFHIEIGRYENDEEYYKRLKDTKEKEKNNNSNQLRKEATQYLKLKKKFENENERGLNEKQN